jgi:hypothetical protein
MAAITKSSGKVRTRTRVVRVAARRGTSAAARAARDRKHTITAIVASAALGYARKTGVKLPTIGGLSPEVTVGLGAAALAMATKNKTIDHVATGLLAVAAYEMAKGGLPTVKVGGEDDEDGILGVDIE